MKIKILNTIITYLIHHLLNITTNTMMPSSSSSSSSPTAEWVDKMLTYLCIFFVSLQAFDFVYALLRRHYLKQSRPADTVPQPPKNRVPPIPKSTIMDLKTYEKQYKDKFEQLTTQVDDKLLQELFEKEKQQYLRDLDKEQEHIEKRINELTQFNGPPLDEYVAINDLTPNTQHNTLYSESLIQAARNQLTQYLQTNETWRELFEKTRGFQMSELEEAMAKFEEIFYDKAVREIEKLYMTTATQPKLGTTTAPIKHTDMDICFEDIYRSTNQNASDDEENLESEDNTQQENQTQNQQQPHEHTLLDYEDEIYKYMQNDVKYGYVQLFFYEMMIKDINTRRQAAIQGKQDDDFMAASKTQYTKTKNKNLANCLLIERTPIGNVFMRYNVEKEGFEYYSDKSVPFAVLETVARKYVITFQCKEVYVIPNRIQMDPSNTVAAQKERTFQFARTSNMTKRRDENERTWNKQKIRSWAGSSSVEPEAPTIPEFKEQINHFINKGKIAELVLLQKVDRKLTNKRLKMSYSEYKKSKQKPHAGVEATVFPELSPSGIKLKTA